MAKTHIETSSGFICDIDEAAFDDVEFAEYVRRMQNLSDLPEEEQETLDNALLCADMFTLILGENGKKKLYKHLRKLNGRPTFKACYEELGDIFKQMQVKKN